MCVCRSMHIDIYIYIYILDIRVKSPTTVTVVFQAASWSYFGAPTAPNDEPEWPQRLDTRMPDITIYIIILLSIFYTYVFVYKHVFFLVSVKSGPLRGRWKPPHVVHSIQSLSCHRRNLSFNWAISISMKLAIRKQIEKQGSWSFDQP